MTFFLDNNMPPKLAEVPRVMGAIQFFPQNKQVAFFIEHWDNAKTAAENARPRKCWFRWKANGKVKPYDK